VADITRAETFAVHITVNNARIYVDIEGASLVPDGAAMRQRPTLVLLHGGPGFDHSLFKPAFSESLRAPGRPALDLEQHPVFPPVYHCAQGIVQRGQPRPGFGIRRRSWCARHCGLPALV